MPIYDDVYDEVYYSDAEERAWEADNALQGLVDDALSEFGDKLDFAVKNRIVSLSYYVIFDGELLDKEVKDASEMFLEQLPEEYEVDKDEVSFDIKSGLLTITPKKYYKGY